MRAASLQKTARGGKFSYAFCVFLPRCREPNEPMKSSFSPFPMSMHLIFRLRHLLLLLLAGATLSAVAQNQALRLDGEGSYAEFPPGQFGNLTHATVEVWAKWDGLKNYSRVFEFGRSWQSMSLFNHATTPDLRFNIYPRHAQRDDSARHFLTASGLIRTNEWIHLAAVSGPGGMLLYANGRLVGQHTNTASFAAFKMAGTNYLGRGLSGTSTDEDFHGEIDEVRIWNYRRSVAQIREDMFKRLSGVEPGLIHLWNFDDGTANDSTANAAHGKLRGNAVVVSSELGLVTETITPAPAVAAAVPPVVPVNVNGNGSSMAGWWIAGALTVLVMVLAWLAYMFRRSGLGSAKIIGAEPVPARIPIEAPSLQQAPPPVAPAVNHEQLKERALEELTSFAKESLVQGLFTQRAALLEAQKQAQQDLVQLEARLAMLELPERIQAYEQRISDLERQLASRGDEVSGLTKATLRLLRQKLSEEKQKARPGHRYN